MNIDPVKQRREALRWLLILALNNSRPIQAHESLLLLTAQGVFSDASAHEIRRELGYLEERKLAEIDRNPAGFWLADLTAAGIDIAEYTVDCRPGIARPEKYWAGSN
ncbi:MAG: hypothetical protein KDI44_14225 [Thiothrix sp.]|nr:hypothetical protein [Thiothrix sp.]HPQ94958.1 hypothetical protein [Thiolinea sp.]